MISLHYIRKDCNKSINYIKLQEKIISLLYVDDIELLQKKRKKKEKEKKKKKKIDTLIKTIRIYSPDIVKLFETNICYRSIIEGIKILCCNPCKIFRTILKIERREIYKRTPG